MSNLTKTISLNISERLSSVSILNGFKGNLDKLAGILEDIKHFAISEEDWEKAERKVTPTKDAEGNDSVQWNWNDEKGGEKEITISESTASYIRETIKEKNDKGEFTLQDKAFITLQAKLV